jgi:hypothetical protein
MPNLSTPQGLFPINRGAGGNMGEAMFRTKAAGTAARIRQFDVVTAANDGTINRTITPGTTPILGVSIDGGAPSTLSFHHVIEEPDAVYAAMVSGAGGAATDVFNNANLLLGSTSTVISDDTIDVASIATSAALDVKLLRLHPVVDTTFGQFAVFEVQINKAMRDSATAGI